MLRKLFLPLIRVAGILSALPVMAFAVDTKDTRMLSQPTIGGGNVAFIYAQDLWVANADGSQPRRLTVSSGAESNPYLSPDGKLVAFSAQYDGNTDVFVVPAAGGVPKRLTWHPGNDLVRGFSPDGKSVLFSSSRAASNNRYTQLFTVPVTGGQEFQLKIPNAFHAAYSPDGKFMAYTPIADAFKQWKNYRGGSIANIWLFNFADNSIVKIPQPAGGCNDSGPMWMGQTIYFRSDRNGEFNLFSYDLNTKAVKQLTFYTDFPILNASAGSGKIVFEQAGYLHTFDPEPGTARKLTIGIAADLLELRERFATGSAYVRSADVSPSGSRAVIGFRGDILTVPAQKGDYRNLTQTTGTHEKHPAWSADGRWIAYLTDASGEYRLHIKSQDGKGAVKDFKLEGTGFYAYPKWSPDGKLISYVDNGRNLYVLSVSDGRIRKVAADEVYTPGAFHDMASDYSPDSKWLAYTVITGTNFRRIYLWSADENKSYALTDGLSDADEAKFSRDGKFLYFFASTDAGPVVNWFDQSNADMRRTASIYLVTLQKSTPSPLFRENDEEPVKPEVVTVEKTTTTSKGKKTVRTTTTTSNPAFKIDWEGIENRIIDLPLGPSNFGNLGVAANGDLLYIEMPGNGAPKLHRYSFTKRSDSEVMDMYFYGLSADGKKMIYNAGGRYYISNAGEKPEPGKGMLNTDVLQVKIDPRAEWQQMFDEAWRMNRDYFYDPGMHGADWVAMKKKYAAFLPDLACRNDLNVLIQWMCSELAVGHHYITNGGDYLNNASRINGGLLGADYEVQNGRYRIRKIYGGLNWTPYLRSPLTEPGVDAHVGDYLLAVNGREVRAEENLYEYFENTAGKITELTLSSNVNGTGTRVVKVVPITSEAALRNRDWVEGNLKKVTQATNGQVAYVYVPNTAGEGHDYFKRYFFPQANRKAVIVDERFNGGGQLADYYINLLQNPYQAHWHMRYGMDLKTPSGSIQGPKIMITDETAGSGGDMLPWMFRKFKVGTLVGKRTWGGLVGILGFPELLDGGSLTAPNVAIWTKDGFIVENEGVAPDIEVEQTPADVIAGRDPQLEKAISIAMEELRQNPPAQPVRPPFPVRVRK
ncbi:S41 family peptidase [Pedobacter sp. SYP-B3415]|uniref:S41 family peptidase n=1 Tax=Pedobacter sp. SYP-B3415 TaxID=2496641 RepID=UPI00101C7410|nr:S41 family peptidase [Pedobacter sp. SYP-B3415]